MNEQQPMVSIIMPAYNAGIFIKDAIYSVVNQDYTNWELLIVNDGSTDNTKEVILSISDNRIHYFEQSNSGVGAARNLALSKMQGKYFCFLDADDVFTENSLSARLEVFEKNPEISFVDGCVEYVDQNLQELIKKYCPGYTGNPLNRLLKLDSSVFFGNTWMVKKDTGVKYRFDPAMITSEDLFFYISICNNKLYAYTSEVILKYRQVNHSATRNIESLEEGYGMLFSKLKKQGLIKGVGSFILKLKIIKILMMSYFFDSNQIIRGISVPFKILFL